MSIERKPGIPKYPEYPYTTADVMQALGLPRTPGNKFLLRGIIDKNTLTPFTDPKTERVYLSEADFLLVAEEVKARKQKLTNSPQT